MNVVFILIGKRMEEAVKVQAILSEYGAIIRTRLGINRDCSEEEGSGFIFLEMCGDEEGHKELCAKLNKIPNVKAESLTMSLPE